jgi:hypothetical protein
MRRFRRDCCLILDDVENIRPVADAQIVDHSLVDGFPLRDDPPNGLKPLEPPNTLAAYNVRKVPLRTPG